MEKRFLDDFGLRRTLREEDACSLLYELGGVRESAREDQVSAMECESFVFLEPWRGLVEKDACEFFWEIGYLDDRDGLVGVGVVD